MRHITAAVDRLESGTKHLACEDLNSKPDSIVEGILKQHNDPKLAAVLALDLLLVGVDTVNDESVDSLNKHNADRIGF